MTQVKTHIFRRDTLEHFVNAMKKYVDFSGRARRKEYWMFVLFYVLIYIGLTAIDVTLGTAVLGLIFALACLLPSISVGVRRLHDTGRSGWWLLLSLIPLVSLILIVFFCLDSEEGDNDYGPNPKA